MRQSLLLLAAATGAAHAFAPTARRRGRAPAPSCLLTGGLGDWPRVEGVVTTSRCFFDVEIDSTPAGRLEFGLFGEVAPRTAENFRALCTGEKGVGSRGKPLHYKGSVIHRVVPGLSCQGGDFTDGDGSGGESIYGAAFADEAFTLSHTTPNLLSMANNGPDTNGSQFAIMTFPAPRLDGKHVVFGEVTSGFELLSVIEGLGSPIGDPLKRIEVVDCGELPV